MSSGLDKKLIFEWEPDWKVDIFVPPKDVETVELLSANRIADQLLELDRGILVEFLTKDWTWISTLKRIYHDDEMLDEANYLLVTGRKEEDPVAKGVPFGVLLEYEGDLKVRAVGPKRIVNLARKDANLVLRMVIDLLTRSETYQQVIVISAKKKDYWDLIKSILEREADPKKILHQSYQLLSLNPREAWSFASRSLELFKKENDNVGAFTAMTIMAEAQRLMNKPQLAIKNLETGLDFINPAMKPKLMLHGLIQLGGLLFDTEKYEDALETFQKADDLAKSIDDVKARLACKQNIAACLYHLKNVDKALKVYQELKSEAEENADQVALAHALNGIAKTRGELEEDLDPSEIEAIAEEAYRLFSSQSLPMESVRTLLNLAEFYEKRNLKQEAMTTLNRAIDFADQENLVDMKNLLLLKKEEIESGWNEVAW